MKKPVLSYAEALSWHLRDHPGALKPDNLYADLEAAAVLKHRNRYVCSKPPTGHHLTTGHVLQIADAQGASALWLCLSPACDLVPGRETRGWRQRLESSLPFIAVELQAADSEWKKGAHRGNHLFLQLGDDIRCFAFTPSGSDAAPRWEQMFARDQGRCNEDFELDVERVNADADGKLSFARSSARIVAQLRYEYALNLLHRLGATLSRVGLDFISLPRN